MTLLFPGVICVYLIHVSATGLRGPERVAVLEWSRARSYHTAAAPPTISESSLVIAACRVLL